MIVVIKEYYDHKGHKFKTVTDMCKYWNIKPDTYKYRIRIGKTVEEALTLPMHSFFNSKPVQDHQGNWFNSVIKMTEAWGVSSPQLYHDRRQKGWTLEEALVGKRKDKIITDHNGKVFKSVKDMVDYWNVPIKTYYTRRYCGWSLEECLTGRKVG